MIKHSVRDLLANIIALINQHYLKHALISKFPDKFNFRLPN